ncbi:MAG: hypothetical protein QM668_04570 [Agriterribacter sp.]
MKAILFILVISATLTCNFTQLHPDGAYELISASYGDSSLGRENVETKTIKAYKNGFWISATSFAYSKITFGNAMGGTYVLRDGKCMEKVSFSSEDSSLIGKTFSFDYKLSGEQYSQNRKFEYKNKQYEVVEKYKRIIGNAELDDSSLEGVWERKKGEWNGQESEDPDFYSFKIFSYPIFIWAQYHLKDKDFIGVGGGRYQFNGKRLIEHLEYLSYGPIVPSDIEIDILKFTADSIQQETTDKVLKEVWKKIR